MNTTSKPFLLLVKQGTYYPTLLVLHSESEFDYCFRYTPGDHPGFATPEAANDYVRDLPDCFLVKKEMIEWVGRNRDTRFYHIKKNEIFQNNLLPKNDIRFGIYGSLTVEKLPLADG